MNKIKETLKISNIVVWFSFAIMSISLILMNLKSFWILKNIDGNKRLNHLQNFKTNADFEKLLNQVNPLHIDSIIDYYRLDFFFMVGYTFFLILAIYKFKYFLQDKYHFNSLFFHIFHFSLALLVILTLIFDVLENWQLIYQINYMNAELIESCYYYNRYFIKFCLISPPLLYVLFGGLMKFFKILK
jgi:hypothetical protein